MMLDDKLFSEFIRKWKKEGKTRDDARELSDILVSHGFERISAYLSTARSLGPGVKDRKGYVYLFRFLDYYKIGWSDSVEKRFQDHNKSYPERLELVWKLEVKEKWMAESFLHRKFKTKRTNGEWFKLTLIDVELVKGLSDGFYIDMNF